MCLTASSGLLKAKQDIRVYKRLHDYGAGIYQSPYRGFKYKEGFHYQEERMSKTKKVGDEVHRGLYAYTTREGVLQNIWRSNHVYVVMYIPKGAMYYLGEYDQVCSTDLIWYAGSKPKKKP